MKYSRIIAQFCAACTVRDLWGRPVNVIGCVRPAHLLWDLMTSPEPGSNGGGWGGVVVKCTYYLNPVPFPRRAFFPCLMYSNHTVDIKIIRHYISQTCLYLKSVVYILVQKGYFPPPPLPKIILLPRIVHRLIFHIRREGGGGGVFFQIYRTLLKVKIRFSSGFFHKITPVVTWLIVSNISHLVSDIVNDFR